MLPDYQGRDSGLVGAAARASVADARVLGDDERPELEPLLSSGDCSRANVALRLNISERTLQNRLGERGTSYRKLLNETRRELAEQYMSEGLHTVSEVAFLLGFSEISSFSRAFRAWTGESPSTYRDRHLIAVS